MQSQYWLVGATWGGKKDVLPQFITRGYWYCWDVHKHPGKEAGEGNSIKNQQKRFEKVKGGDRIAVKRLRGQGATDMDILAIGVVKDVDLEEWRIYVDWLVPEVEGRSAPLKGCTAAIHGPFFNTNENASWVQQIFCL